MNIYTVLSSKPHNEHHLKRYVKFIERCQTVNTLNENLKFERHHICPKTMFPKYKCFIINPWNLAKLTPRQHFIAHIILWKAFPKSSCVNALWFMSNGQWKEFNKYSIIYENLRKSKFFSKEHRKKISETQKEKFKDPTKNPSYGIKRKIMSKDNETKNVRISDIQEYIAMGWSEGLNEFTKEKYAKGGKDKGKKIIFRNKEYNTVLQCMKETGISRFKINKELT